MFTDHLNVLNSYLAPDEQIRAGSYKHEKDRRRFIVSRGMLRIILAKYVNALPEEIQFGVDGNKKPFIEHTGVNLHFNISHAGAFIVITVDNHPVGIDVEYVDDTFDYQPVMEKVFADHEIAAIKESNKSRQMFYTLWTRKEALLKGIGKGIDNDMPQIPSLDGSHALRWISSDWMLNSFALTDDHICSVACNATLHRDMLLNVAGADWLE